MSIDVSRTIRVRMVRSPVGSSARGGSGSFRGPLVHALQRASHQRALVAVRQAIAVAESVDALLVRQQFHRAGPVGAPHAAIDAEGVEDARERIPDVLVRIGL